MSLRQPLLNNYNDIIYGPGKCFHYYQIMSERFCAARAIQWMLRASAGEAAKGITTTAASGKPTQRCPALCSRAFSQY
jgi:hypothetical protein